MTSLIRCLAKIHARPCLKSIFMLTITYGLFSSLSYAEDIISGHYCYTCQSHESIEECRFLTRTMAVRQAIESSESVRENRDRFKDSAQLNDIVQMISTGYIRDLRVINHSEEGRIVCEKIQAKISKREIEDVLRREREKGHRDNETLGIDNN
ncbi:MAG: hypothetical protein JRJ85_14870, partial [Deltaproteobacteria bacterium]|nr:hypothetical protein [Deltaproteobacteria bacterium]